MTNKHPKETFRGLGNTKALRKICFDLMDKGVSETEINRYCDHAGYLGIPGSLGHRYGQIATGAVVLCFGALGAYLGSKINNPSLEPEIIGGLLGICFGVGALPYSINEGFSKPLIQSLIDNHPKELREVYRENGFSDEEIKNIFSRDRYKELMGMLYP